MQKDTIILWADYNKKVNEKMNGFIKTLDPDQWNKGLGGFFASIRALCSHLYITDFNWLKRYKNLREFSALKDSFFDKTFSFKDLLFENMEEYLSKRPELDDKIKTFAGELTDEDLQRSLKYTSSDGKAFEKNFGGLLTQMFNHDTHHRGMISVYLEILGKENDFSSFGIAL
jgi:uncharacterized damage-inducible protein DinB